MSIAAALHKTLLDAGLSIVGVSLGREDDKTTWRIDWRTAPSRGDETLAAQVVVAFDPASVTTPKEPLQVLVDVLVAKGILTQADLPPELETEAKARTWAQFFGLA